MTAEENEAALVRRLLSGDAAAARAFLRSRDETGGVEAGRFRFRRLLGDGGMGRVFAVDVRDQLDFEKPAALKLIVPKDPRQDAQRHQLFIKEARICGLANHPNVVQAFGVGLLGGCSYLLMELVDGVSLEELIRSGGPRPTLAPEVGEQICAGLEHIHALEHHGRPLEVVHRDLKPANLLIHPVGLVRILDFGVARARFEGELSTATDITRGSPSWMAPEQVRGSREIDARTDLYALGLVLGTMVLGSPIFPGNRVEEVLYKALQPEETFEALQIFARAEAAVAGMGDVLRTLLAISPDDRPGSAREAAALLRTLPGPRGSVLLQQALSPSPSAPEVVVLPTRPQVNPVEARQPEIRETRPQAGVGQARTAGPPWRGIAVAAVLVALAFGVRTLWPSADEPDAAPGEAVLAPQTPNAGLDSLSEPPAPPPPETTRTPAPTPPPRVDPTPRATLEHAALTTEKSAVRVAAKPAAIVPYEGMPLGMQAVEAEVAGCHRLMAPGESVVVRHSFTLSADGATTSVAPDGPTGNLRAEVSACVRRGIEAARFPPLPESRPRIGPLKHAWQSSCPRNPWLSNVVEMTNVGVPDRIILSSVEDSGEVFDIRPEHYGYLEAVGLSRTLIDALRAD